MANKPRFAETRKKRKPRINVMLLHAREPSTMDGFEAGERLLVFDTSVTGWKVAVNAETAPRLRAALDATFPAALPTEQEPANG